MAGRVALPHRVLILVATAALLVGAAADTSDAAQYYVATTGNDGDPGTQGSPWRTLQKAGDVAGAGDTVTVAPGTYQGFRPRKSGTAQSPVRFIAEAGVIVTSPGPANSNGDNIWVRNVDYVVIDGFESTGAPRSGIAVQGEPDGNCAGVVIRNCFCHHNTRWGIFTGFARDLVLENNETSYSAVEHGIYVSNSGDRPVVRGNHAHHNNASGIQLNADPSQMGDDPDDPEGDGIINEALIELNVIHDNGGAGGAAINLASVRASLIRNNLLHDNRASGIAGWDDGDNPAYGTRDNRILGNTIVQPPTGRFAIVLINGSINNAVFDNILIHTGTRGSLEVDASSQIGLQSDYNIVVNVFSDDSDFLTLAEWRALGFDAHSIIATPAALFAPGGYRLATTSPARDAGIARADLPSDLDGTTRPQGPQVDIGAYELTASGASPTPSATALPPTATRTRTSTATASATTQPAATSTATPGAPSGNRIAGTLRYYRGSRPVAGAVVELDGPAPQSTTSDAAGQFSFGAVADGNWRLEPRKTGGRGAGVSALDAAYVLQYLAGMRGLDAAQRVACDVSASGSLTPLDATRILQLTVGVLNSFPATTACGSDWLFAPQPGDQTLLQPAFSDGACQPGAISYAELGADVSGQDFSAMLIGDCTGNWQPPAAAGATARRGVAPAMSLTTLRHVPGGRLRAALLLRTSGPLQSIEATLAIDPTRLRLAGARAVLGAREALLLANEPTPGIVAIALASPEPIAAGVRVGFVLEFDRRAPDASRSRVEVARIVFDE
jgi:hypothetical protein